MNRITCLQYAGCDEYSSAELAKDRLSFRGGCGRQLGQSEMKERRHPDIDRRENPTRYDIKFPLVDENGEYVEEDRSMIADRRLNNIAVEELDCEDYTAAVINSEKD